MPKKGKTSIKLVKKGKKQGEMQQITALCIQIIKNIKV